MSMMARQALSKQIDISNLQHLRDEGYSNAEIARQLDISTMTVQRYLGKNPTEINARVKSEAWEKRRGNTDSGTAMAVPTEAKPVAAIENRIPTTTLAVARKCVSVKGVSGITYIVENGKVWIHDEGGTVKAEELTVSTVRQIVAELTTILRHADETDARNQIWD